jgi:hypothetical protein
MKVYFLTIVSEDDRETRVSNLCFRTLNSAIQACEGHARDAFENNVDPNDGERHIFPGLDWAPDMRAAATRVDDGVSTETDYAIHECDLVGGH